MNQFTKKKLALEKVRELIAKNKKQLELLKELEQSIINKLPGGQFMKPLLLVCLALFFVGCSSDPILHETTTMDRELALKIADRAPVIVTPAAPAPIINISYNGSAPSGAPSLPLDLEDTRTNCMNSPVYTMQGQFSHYVKRCFGGQ